MTTKATIHIGLIELPAMALRDTSDSNWTTFRPGEPLISKMILAASLQQQFDVEIVDLKNGDERIDLGPVTWSGTAYRKYAIGRDWRSLRADAYDVWGVTCNFLQYREIACRVIQHLSSQGARVIVGGSDAVGDPDAYLNAGATFIVLDKSGGSNIGTIELALGRETGLPYFVQTKNGIRSSGKPRLHPEEWPLPDLSVVRETLGTRAWDDLSYPTELLPIGTLILDHGCDRHCDFCETPTYKLGYQAMSPKRALEWVDRIKAAGARSFVCCSDQFLGRILWQNGRDEIVEIVNGFRERGMPVAWSNGLEIAKATRGRGFPNSDRTPDRELVQAVWGWDGSVGCVQAYIPAERPLEGASSYAKLLEWRDHVRMVETIVEAGMPDLYYGVIIGLEQDSDDTLSRLLEAIVGLRERLLRINPRLGFTVQPYSIRPLPGTPMSRHLSESGLVRFSDPALVGGWWTPCADTRHLSYRQVAEWQQRILRTLHATQYGAWPGRLTPP